ncbi:unnamed protein product, partial [Durusdinium trenchii]
MIRAIRVWSCSLLWVLVVFVTHTTSEAIATWEQKDPFSAPTPRAFHTMAWSSAAGGLYVFGGVDGSSDLNDLHLYVHEANQWQKINASGDVPSPLYGHTMAWSSAAGGLYVFGRLDSGGYLKDPNDLHLYVHEENEWRRPTFCNCAKPSAAYGHAMAWSSAAGGLYVFGGLGSGEYLSELHLYVHEDPQGWQRKVPFSTPSPRDQPTMAWSSAAGGLYMLGGINSRVQLNEPNDLYLYVPEANQWQKINATGDAPSPCYGHTMGWSSDAGLYVFGGRQLFVDGSGDHNDLHLYVHEANHWQKINATGDVPSPRYGHTMAWSSAAGGLYVFGGLSGGYLNDLYLYVHEANQWQKINALGDVPTPRFRHTMVWSGAEAGGLYLFGGWNLREDYLNDLYLYIHEANQWHEIHAGGDIPSPREGHTMAWSSAAGGLYVFGGSGRGYRYLNDLYLYVVEATQWHHIPNNWQAPSPRSGHTMAWSSAAGGLYVFGGSDDIGGGAAYNDLFFLPEVNVTVAVAPVDVGQKDIIVAAVAISSGSAFFLLLTFCAFYKRQLRLKDSFCHGWVDLELNNPLAIKNFFLYSDACLVRFECLKEIYQKGQAWPRRQEADGMTVGGATALVTRKELEDVMYDEDSRKFYLPSEDDESSKLTEVHFCSVSHSWEAMEHPDPWRDQLRETINRLDHLRSHVWIFYDYASLYQFPRKTNKQMQSFNRALSHMHLLYAHDWVNVEIISKLTDQAVKEKMERDNSYIEVYNVKIGAVGPVPIAELTFNDVPYLERGWCIAEMQWASTREGEDHAVPEPPEQFAKRLCQLKFTHRSDASAVQELQEKVFREKTGRTTKLRFDKLPPEQVHILCSALQHYPKLEMITISRTKLQPTGVAAVLRCRAVLAVLVNCDLRDEEAAAMQDILENETTAVKQLEVGRNDNMSLNASKSLTLAALKKNVKLLLETEAQ